MTKLLVSVRSAEEAAAAVRGGADIIDVKDPGRGSLGAADADVYRAIADVVGNERPLSSARGELLDWSEKCECGARPSTFAKIGPAGLSHWEWRTRWTAWAESLPANTEPVAVAYADALAARSPAPQRILEHAAGISPIVLIDTWDKSGGGLFDLIALAELQAWIAQAHALGLQIALAGSLRESHFPQALKLKPDILAVRGAACYSGRESSLDEGRVRRLKRLVGAASITLRSESLGIIPPEPRIA